MKRKMSVFFTLLFSLACTLCLFACDEKQNNSASNSVSDTESVSAEEEGLVCALVESSGTRVVILVEETDGKATVLDCMEMLKGTAENFTYEIVSGMVTSINGVANLADFSKCWMLYTSDAEMANTEWGTLEYNGKTLGSAIVGAESLDVVDGGIYVWEYVSF